MTSPLESYTASLDKLVFSDEAKTRMARRLARASAATGTGSAAPHLTARGSGALADAADRRSSRRTATWLRAAALLALVAVLGGGGTVAVASGVLPNPANVLSDIFGEAPAQTELLDGIGRPIGASCTSNGVTVTAEAIVGDRFNYCVVYSIEREDGEQIADATANDAGTLNLTADGSLAVDGAVSGGGSAYFYDADPSDNAIQFVQTMSVTTWDGSGIIGRTARFSMNGIRSIRENGESATVASGSWSLKFTMNYVDSSIELPSGQSTTWQGSTVTVDAATVSSLGITVNYTIDRQIGDLGPSGKMSDEATAEQDAVIGLPITVTMADGTVFDATNANSYAEKQANGTSTVSKSFIFSRIVDTNEVASVTVGDATIPVNAS